MLFILSPSKTLDFTSPYSLPDNGDPALIQATRKLVNQLKKMKPAELEQLMKISPRLAWENADRYANWHFPFDSAAARPAFAAYKGEVFEGLRGWELDKHGMEYANRHVRILSGLYGVLKPGNNILPYRLEMGTALSGKNFTNLYGYWTGEITKKLDQAFKELKTRVLVNLASVEYSKAVNFKALKVKVVTPQFKEFRNGEFKFITFSAKRARGLMTRFAIENRLTSVEELKLFDLENYQYMEQHSDEHNWLFVK